MSALPDASRVAFEIHLHNLSHFPESPLEWAYQRDTLGNYCNNRVDDMWHGWQASRKQALEEATEICKEASIKSEHPGSCYLKIRSLK